MPDLKIEIGDRKNPVSQLGLMYSNNNNEVRVSKFESLDLGSEKNSSRLTSTGSVHNPYILRPEECRGAVATENNDGCTQILSPIHSTHLETNRALFTIIYLQDTSFHSRY